MTAGSVVTAPVPRTYKGILWGGLVAGVLDICYAFALAGFLRGRSPVWVLQSVASGLLGARSYQSGLPAAAFGAVAHLLIATTWAAVYFFASRRLPSLVQRPVFCGLVYGIAVYLFMNFVVIPLSAIHVMPNYAPAVLLRGVLGIMLFVGLPIALINRAVALRDSRP